jgi:hypothetical protein
VALDVYKGELLKSGKSISVSLQLFRDSFKLVL